MRKDGSRFWADVIITAVRDESGALRGFSKITRDLTQRRAQEETLRLSEERFRLLVEGVKDYAIYMLDPEGRITSWNSGAERIKGYKARRSSAATSRRSIPRIQREALARAGARHGTRAWALSKTRASACARTAPRFWAHVVVTPLYDRTMRWSATPKVTRDLTDRKRVEALEKAERQTNEFLAMLAQRAAQSARRQSAMRCSCCAQPRRGPPRGMGREVLERQTGQMTVWSMICWTSAALPARQSR